MDFYLHIFIIHLLILINNHLLKLGYLVGKTGDNHRIDFKIKIPLTRNIFLIFYFIIKN